MISLSRVEMRFGGQVLFENVSFRLNPGAHYGLVGANGAGKSTLMKILSGQITPEKGEVARPSGMRMGMLGQDQFQYDAMPLMAVVMMGQADLWEALEEKANLLARLELEGNMTEADGHRLGELEVAIADLDGYTAEARAAQLLEGLGLPTERHHRPMNELSGGYRLRVLLAQTLFQEPDLLLLDEPTNHLDIQSIRWLESHLRDFTGAILVISHDRHFLNAVCNHIADVDYGEVRIYTGNYEAFEASKVLAEEQLASANESAQKKIDHMQAYVDRFRAKASKARQAQSKLKQIEKVELPSLKTSSRQYPRFRFDQRRPSGKEVVRVKGVKKSFKQGKNIVEVLKGVDVLLERGQKMAVVGANGIGKSTLLKIITNHLPPDEGMSELGYEVQTGYFAQDHADQITGKASLYDWLHNAYPQESIGTIRGMLGRVLFEGDEAKKALGALSGGESARLLLAALMLSKDNLLVLDEPTNHLDLEGREALMEALVEYPGTLLFVSHDRHFVSHVANRVLALSADGVEDFHGTYEEYLAREGSDFLSGNVTKLQRNADKREEPSKAAVDNEERKAQKKTLGKQRKQVEKLEAEITRLEAEVAKEEARFADGDYYTRTPQDQQQADVKKLEALRQRLANTEAAWEKASEELEARL